MSTLNSENTISHPGLTALQCESQFYVSIKKHDFIRIDLFPKEKVSKYVGYLPQPSFKTLDHLVNPDRATTNGTCKPVADGSSWFELNL